MKPLDKRECLKCLALGYLGRDNSHASTGEADS